MSGTKPLRFLKLHLTDLSIYTFAVLITKHKGLWVFVRHRERTSWELPAGHVEENETVVQAAKRELFEETGALEYSLDQLVSYQGEYKGKTIFGMLFIAEVCSFGTLPNTEIAEKRLFTTIPEELTYPHIQPQLIDYYLKL